MKKAGEPFLPGIKTDEVQEYEIRGRNVSRKAAVSGIVLLKNENHLLPLCTDVPIALYGAGASHTIKGGTGSGDVNSRKTVSILDGLKSAGYTISSENWLKEYETEYEDSRISWRNKIWDRAGKGEDRAEGIEFFHIYAGLPFEFPSGRIPEKTQADTAIYVLSRQAGEGKDRRNEAGDYQLSKAEEDIFARICDIYSHVVLVINTGGLIDLNFTDRYPNVEAILYMHQAGMEAGNALADIISGKAAPEGKLTDSWPFQYEDYPNAMTFSYMNGDVEKELYTEGIFVGYRYFDTFEIPVRYCFGYGLAYTEFRSEMLGIEKTGESAEACSFCIRIRVRNAGEKYYGRETIQIYVSCPQDHLKKEYRRLAGFQKTKLLAPGESQDIRIQVPVSLLSSYDEKQAGWILEKGRYGIFTGPSLDEAVFCASMCIEQDITLLKTETILPLKESLKEIEPPENRLMERREEWLVEFSSKPEITFTSDDFTNVVVSYGRSYQDIGEDVRAFVDRLKTGQLIQMATGEITKGQASALGSSGITVPGSAAETSNCVIEKGLASIVLADGPAGLRLSRTYKAINGKPVPVPLEQALEDGYLCRETDTDDGETYYQYCTAFPAGTLLAQTWDPDILRECGRVVAEEMRRFGITLWLAPGMNIHRNPLCGRNFEYYSEDPLVSGIMAASMTQGVQSIEGCGTTIKHFAANNQEDNRMRSNSVVSERALREIYLKGFEIAVKYSQPLAIMTSYNLINGIHTANSYDLCTKVARNEWGYKGVIMTDWTTTHNGPDCTASGCIRAGNDLIMPGCSDDHSNLTRELEMGMLDIRDLKYAVGHLVSVIWKSKPCQTDVA